MEGTSGHAMRLPASNRRGAGLASDAADAQRPDEWRVAIAGAPLADSQLHRSPSQALAARHEGWSRAVTQVLRLAQARSTARLQRDTLAAASERGEALAIRARRGTGVGLSACFVGCLVLLAIAQLVEPTADGEGDATSAAVMSGSGLAAYALVATALGLLCITGGAYGRARWLRGAADQAVGRVETLTRAFEEQKSRTLTEEHELRLAHVRAALDAAQLPTVLGRLIADYVEAPEDAPTK